MGGMMRLASNLLAALLVAVAAQTASAQSAYPNRPVKIVVGFTPGTAPDLAARILADRFAEVWGSPFVVENVHGAGSNIGTDRVAKSARRRLHLADGRQLGAGHQPEPVRDAAVRPGQGFCADLAGLHRGERARPSARRAGQERGRCRRARQGAARQALLCAMPASAPRSIWPPNCSNTWRMSTSCRSPIAAPRRSCRTCSRAASPCRSPIS